MNVCQPLGRLSLAAVMLGVMMEGGSTPAAIAAAQTETVSPITAPGLPLPSPKELSCQARLLTAGWFIALKWEDASTGESEFHVERSTDGRTWTEIGKAGADRTSYQDSALPANQTFFYRVRAHRHQDGRFSDFSEVAACSTDRRHLKFQLTASARAVCELTTSHELQVAWAVTGAAQLAELRFEITEPNGRKSTLSTEPKNSGSVSLPLTNSPGGAAQITGTVREKASGATTSQTTSVQIVACRRAQRESSPRTFALVASLTGVRAGTGRCLAQGAQSMAENYGHSLLTADDQGKVERQVQEALRLIDNREVSALVLHPLQVPALAPVVQRAQQQGVAIVSVGEPLAGGEPVPLNPELCADAGGHAISRAIARTALLDDSLGRTFSMEPGFHVSPEPSVCFETIKYPRITAVTPAKLSVNDLVPIEISGSFAAAHVIVEVKESRAGDPTHRFGPLLVSRIGLLDSVSIDLPARIRSGIYDVRIINASFLPCKSSIRTLSLTAPDPGPEWIVALLRQVVVKSNHDGRDNQPAEDVFVLGGWSRKERISDQKSLRYPALQYVSTTDDSIVYPRVPIYWGIPSTDATGAPQTLPTGLVADDLMASELALTYGALEVDDDDSAYWDVGAKVAAVVGCGAAAYLAGDLSGCSKGATVADAAAKMLRERFGEDGNDLYGAATRGCPQSGPPAGTDYCRLVPEEPLRFVLPGSGAIDDKPRMELKMGTYRATGPFLKRLRISLKSVELLEGNADERIDDCYFSDCNYLPEDIWVVARAYPLYLGSQPRPPKKIPEKAPGTTFSMCTEGDRKDSPGKCSSAPVRLALDPTANGRLFSEDFPGGLSIPAVYVEIAVWESTDDNQNLVGLYSNTFFLDSILGEQVRFTFAPEVLAEAINRCQKCTVVGNYTSRAKVRFEIEMERSIP